MIEYYFSLHQPLVYTLYLSQSYSSLLYNIHYNHFLYDVKTFLIRLVNDHIHHHIEEKMLDFLFHSSYIFYFLLLPLLLLIQILYFHFYPILIYLLCLNTFSLHLYVYLQSLKNNTAHITHYHYLYY